MSQQLEVITIERVQRRLGQRGIHDVDFLVTVGDRSALFGFPPWALRAAEIFAAKNLASQSFLRDDEFRALLEAYSQRDRRLGH